MDDDIHGEKGVYFRLDKKVNPCLWNLKNDKNITEVLENMYDKEDPDIINLFSKEKEVRDKLIKKGNWIYTKQSKNLYERLPRQIRLSKEDPGYDARVKKESIRNAPIVNVKEFKRYVQLDFSKKMEDLDKVAKRQESEIKRFHEKYKTKFFTEEKNEKDEELAHNLAKFKEDPENVKGFEIPMKSPHAHYPEANEALDTAKLLGLINPNASPNEISQLVKFYFGVGAIEALRKLGIDTSGYNVVLPDLKVAATPVPRQVRGKEESKSKRKEEPKKRSAPPPPTPRAQERELSSQLAKKIAPSPSDDTHRYVRDDSSFKRENGTRTVRYDKEDAFGKHSFWIRCTECKSEFELQSSVNLNDIVSRLTDNFTSAPNINRIDKRKSYFEIDGCARCMIKFSE